jgi:hypothetical protein
MPDLRLRPISDLLKERFLIPSYQRGYRWTGRQVADLLDDILAFQKESDTKAKTAFYCLQPVVVIKRPDGQLELIDGQQRLTTLFLILTYLKELVTMFGKTRFTLDYETRPDSRKFLECIDPAKANENIDYYHISAAYRTIEEWFGARDGAYKPLLLQCLLNTDEIGKNVKIIWYELPGTAKNPIDVFIRLNIGKIPLTNAELIRALFLRAPNFTGEDATLLQLQIAQEWDDIEKTLQSDDFWYFIHRGNEEFSTRIEYLFRLMVEEQDGQCANGSDPYSTFIAYMQQFTTKGLKAKDEWRRVKRHFMTCEEWFGNRILYHLIGYLITHSVPIRELKNDALRQPTKRAFQETLRSRIFNVVFDCELPKGISCEALRTIISDKLDDLSYEDQRERSTIRSVLLLFNIATLLQNTASNLRFPFDSYKKEEWDIEHIRSVKSDKPGRIDGQKLWLENVLEYWTGSADRTAVTMPETEQSELCAKIVETLDATHFDTGRFDELYELILSRFQETEISEVDHGLANLALLDSGTNRSYKNAVFPIKRRRILELDKSATFVPVCTTNVFLKYYSPKINNMMFWAERDQTAYFEAIVNTLAMFFSAGNGGVE